MVAAAKCKFTKLWRQRNNVTWRHFARGLATVAELSKSEAAVVMNRLMDPEVPVKSGVIFCRLLPVKLFVDPQCSKSLYNGQLHMAFANRSTYPLFILFNSTAFPL